MARADLAASNRRPDGVWGAEQPAEDRHLGRSPSPPRFPGWLCCVRGWSEGWAASETARQGASCHTVCCALLVGWGRGRLSNKDMLYCGRTRQYTRLRILSYRLDVVILAKVEIEFRSSVIVCLARLFMPPSLGMALTAKVVVEFDWGGGNSNGRGTNKQDLRLGPNAAKWQVRPNVLRIRPILRERASL